MTNSDIVFALLNAVFFGVFAARYRSGDVVKSGAWLTGGDVVYTLLRLVGLGDSSAATSLRLATIAVGTFFVARLVTRRIKGVPESV